MENILTKSLGNKFLRCLYFNRMNHTNTSAKYPTCNKNIMDKEKKIHPYRKIHHWKSSKIFINSMLDQIIYNKDGLVAVNKPYGISARPRDQNIMKKRPPSGIPFEVSYTLTDALPSIANKLGYKSLTIVKTPEKFTSGVVLLSADDKITQAIDKSFKRAEGFRIIPRTYWTVTRGIPIYNSGERRVAMKLIKAPNSNLREPHIISSWSNNAHSRGEIKILNVQFKILSSSTYNLASLLEIKSSTSKWHAVRLFASTILMSPILGDQIYGSRVQNIMGRFINISPFVDAAHVPPVLDKDLLKYLKLTSHKTAMIPAHVHLNEIFLPWFIKKGNDITITASPPPEFLWTCEQMNFSEKYIKLDNMKSHIPHSHDGNLNLLQNVT